MPCNGKFNVDVNCSNTGELQLLDISGRLVYSEKISDAHSEINAETLDNGCYIIRIVSESGVGSGKLIIEK